MKLLRTGISIAALLCFGLAAATTAPPGAANSSALTKTTADHSRFKELQRHFDSGPEVTQACLSCHTEAAKQVHHTLHWKWTYDDLSSGQRLGKRQVINNYCTSAPSNYKMCASCHIGYGMGDQFDFTQQDKVDCLVCHDTTGKYKKPAGFAGYPVTQDTEFPPGSGKIIKGIELAPIAQQIGKTSRRSCGTCHFYGGGGDGVKHGDLDSSLVKASKALDVHMASDGLNFSCSTCHKTESHQVPGSRYEPTAADAKGALMRGKPSDDKRNPTTCQSCHGQTPHKLTAKLNDHTDKVACQTCHIPLFARGGVATKMFWDWSTAGKRDKDGKPLVVHNDKGQDIYLGIKGDFRWETDVKPDYIWLNGENIYTLIDTPIDKDRQPIYINKYAGSAEDGKSRIWPIKTFRGKQPFDPEFKRLLITHLAGADDTAFWTNLDWNKAIVSGMQTAGLPFSGKIDFIETISQWPITHMVAPKDKALSCGECHSKNGRLAGVAGIYLPGRDVYPLVNTLGWSLVLFALAGAIGHGLMRVLNRRKDH